MPKSDEMSSRGGYRQKRSGITCSDCYFDQVVLSFRSTTLENVVSCCWRKRMKIEQGILLMSMCECVREVACINRCISRVFIPTPRAGHKMLFLVLDKKVLER